MSVGSKQSSSLSRVLVGDNAGWCARLAGWLAAYPAGSAADGVASSTWLFAAQGSGGKREVCSGAGGKQGD